MGAAVLTKTLRTLAAWLVVVALACHGLIPLGYMPDFSRAAKQPLAMIECHGMDMQNMSMPMPANDNTQDKNGSSDKQKAQSCAPCPFSVNAVFAFGAHAPGISAPITLIAILLAFTAFAFAQRRTYGSHAARAPPLFS